MDDIGAIVEQTIRWADHLRIPPVVYAKEDRRPVGTGQRPLLEFGLHTVGGSTQVSVPGVCIQSSPGTLMVMNAHFGNRGRPASTWGFWCISFDVADSAPWPGIGREPFLYAARLLDPPRVRAAFEAVGRQYQRRTGLHAVRMKCVVLDMLAEIYENLPEPVQPAARPSAPCEAALRVLHERYADPDLTLGQIARAASVSPAHLCRLFRNELGASPMKHLTHIRVDRARDLLRKTTLHVGEVGFAVGFSDRLHFSRVFRKHAGLSPRRFRDELAEAAQAGQERHKGTEAQRHKAD